MAPLKTQPLNERIRAIRAEADARIDKMAEELMEQTPGVPRLVLRNILTNRAFGCQCEAVLNLESEA